MAAAVPQRCICDRSMHPAPRAPCSLRSCAAATGCSCCELAAEPVPLMFDCIDSSARARTILAGARLACGVGLLAFAVWSWSGASRVKLREVKRARA